MLIQISRVRIYEIPITYQSPISSLKFSVNFKAPNGLHLLTVSLVWQSYYVYVFKILVAI